MTEKMRAILVALRDGEHTDWNSALAPNSIGYSIGVQPRGGAQYRSRGPGSIIAPCITALERKGFVHHGARPDGLSGSAYYITPAGIAELKQNT